MWARREAAPSAPVSQRPNFLETNRRIERMSTATSAQVRDQLGHPVIDADGHVLEMFPAIYPFLREELGPDRFDVYLKQGPPARLAVPKRRAAENLRDRTPQGAWWGAACENTLDRATFMFPALLCERMGELGIDFSVLYTTHGLSTCSVPDTDLRLGTVRAFNRYYAEVYGPYREQLTVAAMIPMHTPDEAIAELRHSHELGLKVASFPEGVLRPIEAGPSQHPQLWPGQAHWYDTFGLDSAYDYDPVWATARELGYAPTFHGALGIRPSHTPSPTSYVCNHVGMFAGLVAPVCKSLFMGGVTRRFPDLPFAFLECGVSWAMQMLNDFVEHWEKRNLDALSILDPSRLDVPALTDYFDRYGAAVRDRLEGDFADAVTSMAIDDGKAEGHDEWEHLDVRSAQDIVDRFSPSFYFGCEADDRGVATAFPPFPPCDARLNAIFSSDMGHWDVSDVSTVLAEAHELVSEGLVSSDDFRRFTFENPARLYLAANPAFFEGTAVEKSTAALKSAGAGVS